MRRIKLTLISIVLLGVVGGALAFKAKYEGDIDICYTFLVNGACQNPSGTCLVAEDVRVTPTGSELCTTARTGATCNGANCIIKNKFEVQSD